MNNVIFNEETHTYMVGDKKIPSVTQILKGAGLIDTTRSNVEAMQKGTYVHTVLEFIDKNPTSSISYIPEVEGYIIAYRKFLADVKPVVKEIELRMSNGVYAGTLDRVYTIKGSNDLIDIKTGGKYAWHEIQTYAYKSLYNNVDRRFSLYLKDDGNYKFVQHTNDSRDAMIWNSALAINNFKRGVL